MRSVVRSVVGAWSALRPCPAPTALDITCVEPGANLEPGPLYYQVVGVCWTGLEGPN